MTKFCIFYYLPIEFLKLLNNFLFENVEKRNCRGCSQTLVALESKEYKKKFPKISKYSFKKLALHCQNYIKFALIFFDHLHLLLYCYLLNFYDEFYWALMSFNYTNFESWDNDPFIFK